ncbi:MAG TPA: MFS transporter, partial [Burkholderiales bacterium]|nr:MFS transporter [Burkholderiales bacterium]
MNARATRREWIGLAVLALPCLLYSMDLTVLNLALPAIGEDLAPSAVQQLWIVDVYGFLVAGSLITMGTLGDRIGRRRLLMVGAVVFGAASVLAAFSTSAGMLIVTRALLGVAGATIAPSTLSLIRTMFEDPRERTFAISVWISSFSVGAAIGPVVGGALLEWFWWGSVFLLAVPVMVLLLLLGPVLLPEYRDPHAGRLDLPSALLSVTAVLALIFGLKEAAYEGVSTLPALAILASIVLGAMFLRRQRRLADPHIDVRLFRLPSFGASLAVYTLGTFVAFGIFVFMVQYLQLVLGMAPLEAGLWTVPFALGFVVGSIVSTRLVRRWPAPRVMAGGLLVAAAGYLLVVQAASQSGAGLLMAGMVLQSLGMAPVFTLTNDLIIGTAPP